jgi:hypothetical protein
VGLGVDVGIDAQADRRLLADRASDGVEAVELGRRFDVEAQDAGFQRQAHFGRGLADAGENDLLADRAPAASTRVAVRRRNDVEAGATAGEHVEDAEVGVGLDRVADERIQPFQLFKKFVQ